MQQVQQETLDLRDRRESLEILQLLQIHHPVLLMQVMHGLTLLMEKHMFIMIHIGLKQVQLL